MIARVAVPVPVRRLFDYRAPPSAAPGSRVRVAFGRRTLVGVVMSQAEHTEIDDRELRSVTAVLDEAPILGPELLALARWTAQYYQSPIGEVVDTMLPATLRRGRGIDDGLRPGLGLTDAGRDEPLEALGHRPLQRRLVAALRAAPRGWLDAGALREISAGWRPAARALVDRGWASAVTPPPAPGGSPAAGPPPTPAQRAALAEIEQAGGAFRVFVLHGVTGSGKTEVYLHAAAGVLAAGGQVMVIVPEIALTPQLVERLVRRLGAPVAVLHSGLPAGDRHRAWVAAARGAARVLLGTRSAVFAPAPRLGLVVVDEEHDVSLKQRDGVRYHARDVAVMRASLAGIPVVLGSATPSFETYANVIRGRYRRLVLPRRPGAASLPRVELVDMARVPMTDGMSAPLEDAIAACLERREQALVFLNRRGFAPMLLCVRCRWQAHCERCDSAMTLHRGGRRLRCHFCGAGTVAADRCPGCGGEGLVALGSGTQRVEERLRMRFPSARIARLDRDSTRSHSALEAGLEAVRQGDVDIVVGTQLLSKGHDFPGVTLVGVVNADQGLLSVDFRAPERLFQQLVQVSGRAGRGASPGVAYLQTLNPESAYYRYVREQDFDGFARVALAERESAGFPPYAYLALLRADSKRDGAGLAFLGEVAETGRGLLARSGIEGIEIMDATPSPMEKRAGYFRAQLLVRARRRAALGRFLDAWVGAISEHRDRSRVRWSVDVDPVDLY